MPRELEHSINTPTTVCPLTDDDFSELIEEVPPLDTTNNYAMDLYEKTKECVLVFSLLCMRPAPCAALPRP